MWDVGIMRAIALALIAISGTVLSFTSGHAAPVETVIYSFTGGSDGAAPQGVLVADAAGNLYGTASAGGVKTCIGGCGVVFKLARPTAAGQKWTETVLHAFRGGVDGSTPLSALIFDAKGALYGTTAQGGGSTQCFGGCGTVFKMTPPAASGKPWTEAVLYRFAGGANGSAPLGGLAMGAGGALYGTTAIYPSTGSSCIGAPCGTVFKLSPPVAGVPAWRLTVLHTFAGGNDGSLPLGTLLLGKGGILYGVTGLGGSTHCLSFGCGVVFQMTPPTSAGASWTETVIHDFQGGPSLGGGSDGAYPSSDLVMDANGALYGTTLYGTGNGCGFGCGTVFKLTPPAAHSTAWADSTLYAFKGGKDGESPATGRLAFNTAGMLFGTTPSGGAASDGTVFRLTPAGTASRWTEAVIHSFTGKAADGSDPQGGVILVSEFLYGTTINGGQSGAGTVFQVN